jgi:hypothetical protein
MAKQPKNKKDGVQPSWSRKPLSEDQKRSMSVATRKFNKSFKPASGKVEFTADKLAQDYIMSGGPVVGFGTKSSSAIDLKKGPKNPGQSTPDAGESEFGFVRKSTTKKVLTRPTKKVLTKIESKKSTKK